MSQKRGTLHNTFRQKEATASGPRQAPLPVPASSGLHCHQAQPHCWRFWSAHMKEIEACALWPCWCHCHWEDQGFCAHWARQAGRPVSEECAPVLMVFHFAFIPFIESEIRILGWNLLTSLHADDFNSVKESTSVGLVGPRGPQCKTRGWAMERG